MAVEYDLVVIGGSTAGIYAAVTAARLQARVALVEPQPQQKNWLEAGLIHGNTFAQQFGVPWETGELGEQRDLKPASTTYDHTHQQVASIQFAQAWEWASEVVSTLEEQHSPAVLASLGVDVIAGEGEFCRRPHLAFVVKNRHLRARAYLIATGSRQAVTDIEGLQTTGYLTPRDIWQQPHCENLPSNCVVIGGNAVGTELAQALARLGATVTLVVRGSHILPLEDPEAAHLVQAQLEAEGVCVLTQTEVTQVKSIEGKKWVLAGNKAIEADEIMVAAGQQPNLEALNLEGVGVKWNRRGIQVNKKLQTTNPRIYACGDVIGGYQFPHIANYEARIALKNALFLPVFKVNYRGIPWAIFSNPILTRVGLTEAQARRRYGKEILVLRQYFKTVGKALLLGETTGLCKIIVRGNGEILGATIVGPEADELIHAIALAIRQKLKVGAIADLPHISPTLSEITHQAAAEWHHQRLSSNTRLKDLLEGFFNLRRSWCS
ncbi:MAG: NAD(P)/FAD-dependent oxidoreductase [Aphanothece sp. CMT-3BRIN-NPC111]|jgi:pyruvate/2-oxoglutarate dehydrogenase complex dihydrolipoamide dehydrogenase (E3) component|nr:NAD(P)/FAD-dependent oxidoreductase [Aphanothece sp. CMT-3BRIN-NPC111]